MVLSIGKDEATNSMFKYSLDSLKYFFGAISS